MSNIDHTASGHTLASGSILHENYIIDSVLGEGGFGITYSGIRVTDESPIAIKEYKVNHFSSSQKGMQRFLNEASLLKEFHHLESIVSIFDVFEENNTAYIVMEYIEGITLKELIINEGALSFTEMLSLFKPVFFDLHEIHKKGLVHRDISPDNLIVGLDNHLHLIDFGAASFINPNETKTMTVILKSGYAPPEQYISDGKIGAWTDVYALCATMFMVLSGEKPMDSIKRMQQDTFSFNNSKLEDYQKDAIYRGLSLNYAERFSSTKLLYQALTTPLAKEMTTTHAATSLSKKIKKQISTINQPPRKRQRKKQFALSLCLILLYCSLGILGMNVPLWPQALTIFKNSSETKTTLENPVSEKTTSEHPSSSDTVLTSTKHTSEELTSTILTMINLVGTPIENAKSALNSLDSSMEVLIVEEHSTEQATGFVISQSIAENTQFTSGQIKQIQLVVSKGPEAKAQTTQASNNYNVKANTESETSKKDDGYTTIHLD